MLRGDVPIHSAFKYPNAQEKQHQTKSAANKVGIGPATGHFDSELRYHGSHQPKSRHYRRSDGAQFLGQRLTYQRDSRTKFACKPNTRNKSQQGIPFRQIGGWKMRQESARNIGQRIHQDRPKKHRQPAAFIAQNAPDDPADQQSSHLKVENHRPIYIGVQTQVVQTGHAHDAKEQQVIDINKIAQRGHHDRKAEKMFGLLRCC